MTTIDRNATDIVGCSSISFRHRSLGEALAAIEPIGFTEIDLGALPGICNHVPFPLTGAVRLDIVALLEAHNLRIRSVNADPGDLNDPSRSLDSLVAELHPVIELAAAVGAAVVVPCGAQSAVPFVDLESDLDRVAAAIRALSAECHRLGVRLWVEALHSGRLSNSTERATALLSRVPHEVAGLVFDVSHIVAVGEDPVEWLAEVGDRVEHVHLRDAVPGNINLSIGRGSVDFAGVIGALESAAYRGHYSLELETHDVAENERERVADEAFGAVSGWLSSSSELSPL